MCWVLIEQGLTLSATLGANQFVLRKTNTESMVIKHIRCKLNVSHEILNSLNVDKPSLTRKIKEI